MMLSTDFHVILSLLWAVRHGRCRTDISFDTGRAIGYLTALSVHNHITDQQRARINQLLDNAQQQAMCVVYDLEAQGWA